MEGVFTGDTSYSSFVRTINRDSVFVDSWLDKVQRYTILYFSEGDKWEVTSEIKAKPGDKLKANAFIEELINNIIIKK